MASDLHSEVAALREDVAELTEQIGTALAALEGGAAPWLNVQQAASYTGLGVKTIRRLISSGKLPAKRPSPGRIVIKRRELDAFLSGCG